MAAPYFHVLYVDDVEEREASQMLTSLVLDFKVPVVFSVVSDCFEALQRVRTSHLDLIMLKHPLPCFDALDFVRLIRKIGNSTGVVMVTNVSFPSEFRSHILSSIELPFSIDSFRRTLAALVDVWISARYENKITTSLVNSSYTEEADLSFDRRCFDADGSTSDDSADSYGDFDFCSLWEVNFEGV